MCSCVLNHRKAQSWWIPGDNTPQYSFSCHSHGQHHFSSLTGTGEKTQKTRGKKTFKVQPSAWSSPATAAWSCPDGTWNSWSSLGCGRGWNKKSFKVFSNPNCSVIPWIPQSSVLPNSSPSKGRDSKPPCARCTVGFPSLWKRLLHQLTGISLVGTCPCSCLENRALYPSPLQVKLPRWANGAGATLLLLTCCNPALPRLANLPKLEEPAHAWNLSLQGEQPGEKLGTMARTGSREIRKERCVLSSPLLQMFSCRRAFFLKRFFKLQGKGMATLRWPFNKLQPSVN